MLKDNVFSALCVLLVIAGLSADQYPNFSIGCVVIAVIVAGISTFAILRNS